MMPLRERLASAPSRPMVTSVSAAFGIQLCVAVSGVLAARALGVEDRGHLALFMILPTIAAQLGVIPPVAATYYIAKDPRNGRAVVGALAVPSLLQALALTSLHIAILLVLLASSSGTVHQAGLLTLPAVPALLAQLYGLAVLQGEQRFTALNALRIIPAIIYACGVGGLLVADAGNLAAITAIWIGSFSLAGSLTLFIALRRLPRPASQGQALDTRREMLRFGARAWFGTTSPSEFFQLDQAIAGIFLSAFSLGLYTTAVAFTNLPRFVAQSVGLVAYPNVAASPPERQRSATWRYGGKALLLCGSIVAALEASIGWLLPFLFGDDFEGAVSLTRILLVGALLYSLRRVLIEGARGAGRPGLGSAVELISLLALLIGIAALAPPFGVKGIAVAVCISAGVGLLVLCCALLMGGNRDPASMRLSEISARP
jgi:O-antigen/teichoic acid export membrane protein